MRTIEINKNSWHFKLLRWMELYPDGAADFCHYCRKLFGAAFLLTMIGFLAVLALFLTGETVAWLAWMALNMAFIEPYAFAVIGGTLWASLLVLAMILGAFVVKEKLPEETREVIDAAWDSFHSKVCFKVSLR